MILSKVSCFGVKVPWWVLFGVSSLSDLCLAGNVVALLDEVTGLYGIGLLPVPDDSSYGVSNESYEDEDSD